MKKYFIIVISLFFIIIGVKATNRISKNDLQTNKIIRPIYLFEPALNYKLPLSDLEKENTLLAEQLDSLFAITNEDNLSINSANKLKAITNKVLSNFSFTLFHRTKDAFQNRNVRKFKKHAADFLDLGIDLLYLNSSVSDRNNFTNQLSKKNEFIKWVNYISQLENSLIKNNTVSAKDTLIKLPNNKLNNGFNSKQISKTEHLKLEVKIAKTLFEKYKIHLVNNYLKRK